MPLQKSKSCENDWVELFRKALTQKVKEPEGSGWKTKVEIATVLKTTPTNISQWVLRQKRAGLLEVFTGTQLIGKRAHRQVWYRPKG